MTDQPTTVDLLVILTRLETKLDHATAGIADHEARLRAVEEASLTDEDLTPFREADRDLKADVDKLKSGRWPLPAVAALTGLGALAISAWQATGH